MNEKLVVIHALVFTGIGFLLGNLTDNPLYLVIFWLLYVWLWLIMSWLVEGGKKK